MPALGAKALPSPSLWSSGAGAGDRARRTGRCQAGGADGRAAGISYRRLRGWRRCWSQSCNVLVRRLAWRCPPPPPPPPPPLAAAARRRRCRRLCVMPAAAHATVPPGPQAADDRRPAAGRDRAGLYRRALRPGQPGARHQRDDATLANLPTCYLFGCAHVLVSPGITSPMLLPLHRRSAAPLLSLQ